MQKLSTEDADRMRTGVPTELTETELTEAVRDSCLERDGCDAEALPSFSFASFSFWSRARAEGMRPSWQLLTKGAWRFLDDIGDGALTIKLGGCRPELAQQTSSGSESQAVIGGSAPFSGWRSPNSPVPQ